MSQAQFDKAVSIVRRINEDKGPIKLDRNEKLTFYKFFKQATEGDNTTKKPGMLEFVEKFKWDAWNNGKGMPQDEALKKYVEHFFETLKKRDNDEARSHIREVEALS